MTANDFKDPGIVAYSAEMRKNDEGNQHDSIRDAARIS